MIYVIYNCCFLCECACEECWLSRTWLWPSIWIEDSPMSHVCSCPNVWCACFSLIKSNKLQWPVQEYCVCIHNKVDCTLLIVRLVVHSHMAREPTLVVTSYMVFWFLLLFTINLSVKVVYYTVNSPCLFFLLLIFLVRTKKLVDPVAFHHLGYSLN